MCLVGFVQHMWQTGEIPQELGWNILVLIPKVTTDTWDIGLLMTLYKVVEDTVDTRLKSSLQFHDVLDGFRDRRETGTSIM